MIRLYSIIRYLPLDRRRDFWLSVTLLVVAIAVIILAPIWMDWYLHSVMGTTHE